MQKRRAFGPPLVFMYLSVGPRSVRRPHIPGVENRELAAECRKTIHINITRNNPLTLAARCRNTPVRVYQRRTAAIVAPRILPCAVHTRDITLVLDGTRPQKRIPYGDARRRPVGCIYDHVVVAAAARKDRKAQIITYLQQDPHAAPLDNNTPTACSIVVGLATHGKQMPLVIIFHTTIGTHEIHTVKVSSPVGYRHASSNGRIISFGHTPHPRHGSSSVINNVGSMRRIDTKSRCEHLRKNDKIDTPRITRNHLRQRFRGRDLRNRCLRCRCLRCRHHTTRQIIRTTGFLIRGITVAAAQSLGKGLLRPTHILRRRAPHYIMLKKRYFHRNVSFVTRTRRRQNTASQSSRASHPRCKDTKQFDVQTSTFRTCSYNIDTHLTNSCRTSD